MPTTMGQAFVAEFEPEMANTRRMLERVPWEKADWKPHPKSYSMGALATHIADLPGWGGYTLQSDSLDLASAEGQYRPEPPRSTVELLQRFDRNVAQTRAAVAAATDEQLLQPWSLRNGSQVIFTLPRIAVLKGSCVNHTIHHRAQLGVYLRLNDLPVPGMYGPSADEAM